MSDARIIEAAMEWYMARNAFLKLPANDPKAKERLNDLANAEDRLSRSVREGVNEAFGPSEGK